LQRFESQGLAPFVDGWNRSDWLRGRQTTVDTAAGPINGIAQGIDDGGALLLMTQQGRQRNHSGSVVLPMPGAAP
jgi:BirA family biotin operon repressor/biotin-[acetyl-CoA-carboxylase] ligase